MEILQPTTGVLAQIAPVKKFCPYPSFSPTPPSFSPPLPASLPLPLPLSPPPSYPSPLSPLLSPATDALPSHRRSLPVSLLRRRRRHLPPQSAAARRHPPRRRRIHSPMPPLSLPPPHGLSLPSPFSPSLPRCSSPGAVADGERCVGWPMACRTRGMVGLFTVAVADEAVVVSLPDLACQQLDLVRVIAHRHSPH